MNSGLDSELWIYVSYCCFLRYRSFFVNPKFPSCFHHSILQQPKTLATTAIIGPGLAICWNYMVVLKIKTDPTTSSITWCKIFISVIELCDIKNGITRIRNRWGCYVDSIGNITVRFIFKVVNDSNGLNSFLRFSLWFFLWLRFWLPPYRSSWILAYDWHFSLALLIKKSEICFQSSFPISLKSKHSTNSQIFSRLALTKLTFSYKLALRLLVSSL